MFEHASENLQRLMAERGWSISQVIEKTSLDERTIRGILAGTAKPHSQTLHRLAKGLGVAADEFFLDPSQLLYRHFDRHFDRQSNPLVEEVLQTHRELFDGWTEADFDELHSRVGSGGALSFEGALAAVAQMNRKRELHEKLDVLLESSQAETLAGIVEVLYRQVAADGE